MKPTRVRAQPRPAAAQPTIARDVPSVLAGSQRTPPQILAGMARYGMPAENALGRRRGRHPAGGASSSGAITPWPPHSGRPASTRRGWSPPMSTNPDGSLSRRWTAGSRDFDNWGICDTVCFVLFDRTPHAWAKVEAWSDRPEEFVKRAAFALLWGLTRHDKAAPDARFLHGLELIETGARDERHFVQKAVNMALRATGKRNRRPADAPPLAVARRLAASPAAAPRWVGKDALRELQPTVRKATGKGPRNDAASAKSSPSAPRRSPVPARLGWRSRNRRRTLGCRGLTSRAADVASLSTPAACCRALTRGGAAR